MNLQVLASARRAFLLAVVASMFVVITAMPVIAQISALSSIRGTVTDATGAALPGVNVTASPTDVPRLLVATTRTLYVDCFVRPLTEMLSGTTSP